MEWNLENLENDSKNGMACPKRILSLKCIQSHHLKVDNISFVSPHVIDRNSRYVVFIINSIVIFSQKQHILHSNKTGFVQRGILKFFIYF